ANLVGATVAIIGGFTVGQDVLGFADQNGITGSFNPATGVLTLSGTAGVALYQAALRSVTYLNSSRNPSTLTRVVTFTVDDGSASNNLGSATRAPPVAAVNDAPVVTASAGVLAYVENQPATAIDAGLALGDVDSPSLVGATVALTTGFAEGQD